MKHSNAELSSSSRIVPPDSLLKFGYSPNGGIEFDSASALLGFSYNGTVKADIGPLGLTVRNGEGLIVGHPAQLAAGSFVPEFQVLGTSQSDSSAWLARFSSSNPTTAMSSMAFLKSGSDTVGSNTIVTDGEALGQMRWFVDDGNDYTEVAARIVAFVDDSSPAEDAVGGAIALYTTGVTGTDTEALRIDSSQSTILSGILSVDDTTDSTSVTTGSIHTDGGLGVAKDAIVGSDVKVGTTHFVNVLGDSGGIQLDRTDSADPFLQFLLSGSTKFTLGVDNSDSDKFGIFRGASVGINPAFTISATTQDTTFGGYPIMLITDTDATVEGALWYDASEDKLKFKTAAGVETITSS